MLQQTITHSVNQSIVQSVRVHAAPCAPMCLNSRPCASMRAHASFSTTVFDRPEQVTKCAYDDKL